MKANRPQAEGTQGTYGTEEMTRSQERRDIPATQRSRGKTARTLTTQNV